MSNLTERGVLNQLIETCSDAENGFRTAATLEAVNGILPASMRDLVERQLVGIRAAHRQLEALRADRPA